MTVPPSMTTPGFLLLVYFSRAYHLVIHAANEPKVLALVGTASHFTPLRPMMLPPSGTTPGLFFFFISLEPRFQCYTIP